jgi:hypothetical protein
MDRRTVVAGIITLRAGYEGGSGGSTMGPSLIMKDRLVEATQFME